VSWERSDRRSRLPADWAARREAVRARAGGLCELCNAPGNQCDHVERGDDHSLENLQWLCRRCHTAKTQREANAARVSERRPPGRHPGLV
jgi:5-methylcytosine-specific restriction protein A